MLAKLVELQVFEDPRGLLSAGSIPDQIPFEVKRFFITSANSSDIVRGRHAHKTSHQLLVAVHGSVKVKCDDGRSKADFLLNSVNTGLYIPPLIWGEQTEFSPGAKLLVLASGLYELTDYIRNFDEFRELSRLPTEQ